MTGAAELEASFRCLNVVTTIIAIVLDRTRWPLSRHCAPGPPMSALGQTLTIYAWPSHDRFTPLSRRTMRRVSTSALGQELTQAVGF